MEEKNRIIENYIINAKNQLIQKGYKISETQVSNVINKFTNSDKSLEEIKKEIDELIEEFIKNYIMIIKQNIQTPTEEQNNEMFQTFNYHTHTNRCGHADMASDEEYVRLAKEAGITQLGFSDHVPVTELESRNPNQQMHISEIDEYITSIANLKKKYKDIQILVGFEAEFDSRKEQYLGELRDKVDYMILGQHFITDAFGEIILPVNNPNYPTQYAEVLCQAMNTGIFDIVAHPDIFMQFRDTLDSEQKKKLFMDNARAAIEKICKTAEAIGIPLEINFEGISKKDKFGNILKYSDGEFAYPHSEFWKIASETGVKVLYGVDAHNPEHFRTMIESKQKIDAFINPTKLNFVNKNYNPVTDRNENLQNLYKQSKEKSLTYETHIISQLASSILDAIPNESFSPDAFLYIANQKITTRIKQMSEQNKALEKNPNLTEVARTQANNTNNNQQAALTRAIETIKTSTESGCQSKEEFKSSIREITEYKTTKNENKKRQIENNIKQKRTTNTQERTNQKTKTLTLTKKLDKSSVSNNNNGFINITTTILLITLIFIIGISIGYIIIK